jgi:hypothetical protein
VPGMDGWWRRSAGLRRSRAQSGWRLGLDGFRGRARVRAGAGLGRAAACEVTAAGEGVEGAPLDFNRRAELGCIEPQVNLGRGLLRWMARR